MRIRQAFLIFRALFTILISGLFFRQIIQGDYYYNQSRRNVIRVIPLEATRGKILDRNGVIIVDTMPSFNVLLIPQEINDKDALFNKLSEILDVPLEEIKQNYKRKYFNPFLPIAIYENLNKDKIIAIEENKLNLPGVIIDTQPHRFYPFSGAASHILGYLSQIDTSRITKLKPYGYESNDLVGYSGIEEYYDLILRGEKGGEQVEVDNRGRRVRTAGFKPPKSGQDIQITIDIHIQQIVDKSMEDKRGAVVIMDPYSGEIISLSSHPDYDPNDFIENNNSTINDLLQDRRSPLFNRATAGQYPPGSVFKIVTAIAALEKDPWVVNKTFYCDGNMQIGNRNYNCWSAHGDENLRDAVMHSCNIFFYNLGILIGPEAITKYAHMIGLGRTTGIDLNYETKGFIPSPSWKKIISLTDWRKGDTANMAIGQGEVLVTPLQMTRTISILANGGRLVQPHLIKAVRGREVVVGKNKTVKLSDDTLGKISSYLYEVVNNPQGTAHVIDIQGLKIYAKTGTAQVSGKSPHGWLVGFVGRDKPKYAFCVFLENGGSSYNACLVAKIIFGEMLDKNLI